MPWSAPGLGRLPMQKHYLTFLEALQTACDFDPRLKLTLQQIKEKRQKQANDMAIGRVALDLTQCPGVDRLLRLYHPELYQDDAELRAQAMVKFIRHPDSEPFRVNAKI